MTSYGGPSILNPDYRRSASAVGAVGGIPGPLAIVTPPVPDASALRTTAARPYGPILGSVSSGSSAHDSTQALEADKSQPIKKRRGGSRRACNECKQQKVYLILACGGK